MSRVQINIVYANNNMRADVMGPFKASNVDADVTWSREEQPGADVVVHWNSWTHRRRHISRNPDAFRILYIYEPIIIDPLAYRQRLWASVDAILTWNHHLASSGPEFTWFPLVYHDLPFSPGYGVETLEESDAHLLERPRSACMICGDQFSLIRSELYSLRREIAEFHSSLQSAK